MQNSKRVDRFAPANETGASKRFGAEIEPKSSQIAEISVKWMKTNTFHDRCCLLLLFWISNFRTSFFLVRRKDTAHAFLSISLSGQRLSAFSTSLSDFWASLTDLLSLNAIHCYQLLCPTDDEHTDCKAKLLGHLSKVHLVTILTGMMHKPMMPEKV